MRAGMTGIPSLSAAFDQQFVAARLRRGQEEVAVRGVLDARLFAEDADELLDLVVVRRDVFVANRPVEAESVARLRLEVVRPHAQRDAAPMVGPPAEHPRRATT